MAKRLSKELPELKELEEEDPQFIADIVTIGKSLVNTVKQMAVDQDRPLYTFVPAIIQALIVSHEIFVEDDPFLKKFRESETSS